MSDRAGGTGPGRGTGREARSGAGREPGREVLFPRRTVVLGTFVPTVILEIGIGAATPLIVATATSLGSSLALAGVLAALPALGQILADLPAGTLADRLGDRAAMLLAGALAGVGFVLAALAPTTWALSGALLLVGMAAAVFHLARHSYLTEITAPLARGRVLTTLAGVHRFGAFLGPFAGAGVVLLGGVRAGYWLGAACALLAALVLLAVGPDDKAAARRTGRRRGVRAGDRNASASIAGAGAAAGSDTAGGAGAAADARRLAPTMRGILAEHWRVLATLGIGVFLVGAVRGARQTVLPLWGEHLGLDPATVSLVVGIAAAVDVVIFYPSGMVMDAFGRMWTGIPGALGMGISLALLPLTGVLWSFVVVAVLLGAANGWSSGILMTLGSDVAPARGRAKFLGAWRVIQDSGGSAGPLIVAGVAAISSLALGIWAVALTGLGAALALWHWVPRWSVHATRATRRAAGIGR